MEYIRKKMRNKENRYLIKFTTKIIIMSRKIRTTKGNVGIVYLFTNELYERENLYKYGITINPFQRKRVQSNSTPPTYPFYDRIVMFSKSYKEIEKQLSKKFEKNGLFPEKKG